MAQITSGRWMVKFQCVLGISVEATRPSVNGNGNVFTHSVKLLITTQYDHNPVENTIYKLCVLTFTLHSHTMIDTWPQRKSPNVLEFEPSILRFHTPTDTWLHRNSPNAFAIEPSVFRCNLGRGFLGFTTSAFILVVGLSYDPNPPSFNSLNSVLLSSVDRSHLQLDLGRISLQMMGTVDLLPFECSA